MNDGAVMFRGCKQVVDAYVANGMGPWAVVHGKDVCFADEAATVEEGQEALRTTLQRLHEGMSKAIFELRVYKLKKGAEIDSSTAHARAFKFRLYSEMDPSPFDLARNVVDRQAQAEIDGLKAQLKTLQDRLDQEEEIEEEDEGMNLNKMIAGVIEMPGVKAALQDKLIGFIHSIVPMRNNPSRPAAVAGIEQAPDQRQQGQVVLQPGQIEKVQQAINQLATKDPVLGDHLLKVAQIATDDPGKYNMLVGIL